MSSHSGYRDQKLVGDVVCVTNPCQLLALQTLQWIGVLLDEGHGFDITGVTGRSGKGERVVMLMQCQQIG